MSSARGPSPDGESNDKSDSSITDLLARVSALSAPTHEARQRDSSPDALGSIDALTDRFTKLFNRVPVSATTKPATSYSDEEDIDPRIFLSSITNAEPITLTKEHKWKDLVEVDDNDFETALRELSSKEWELSMDELAELEYLESTVVVPRDGENGNSGVVGQRYLKSVAEDLNSKARDLNEPVNEKIREKALEREAKNAQIDAEKLLGSYTSENGENTKYDTDSDEKAGYSRCAEKPCLSEEDEVRFQSDKRDIEEQADRLVKMYASLPGSGIPEKSFPDGDNEKDEDEEAEELVDMYTRLASDDEEEKGDDDSGKAVVGEEHLVDTADLFAQLQSLKSPQTSLGDLSEIKPTDVSNLPDVPSVILPSVPTDIISKKLREDAELGCCMCSDDVEYRCMGCERLDEDYLYCSKCFLLSHLSEQAGYDERSHRYKKFSL
ncbi:hypothetical protein V1517DRAFT_320245 [Lipomyces orientalis]|uniref:Uncharacterized protein n=1 Tax=Lipomyces orientalis TaxID=1233043 RepID=A0ACC3TQK8_9ASCO